MDYFEVYRDIWNFHKRYRDIQNTEEFWNEVIAESSKIYEKYNKNKFVLDLLVTVVNEIDRVYKETGADANKRIS